MKILFCLLITLNLFAAWDAQQTEAWNKFKGNSQIWYDIRDQLSINTNNMKDYMYRKIDAKDWTAVNAVNDDSLIAQIEARDTANTSEAIDKVTAVKNFRKRIKAMQDVVRDIDCDNHPLMTDAFRKAICNLFKVD